MGTKIKTEFWAKPIPLRQFDWSAWYDGDEPNDNGSMPVGHGRTEVDALNDLVEKFPRDGVDCPDCNGGGSVIGFQCATCEGTGDACLASAEPK